MTNTHRLISGVLVALGGLVVAALPAVASEPAETPAEPTATRVVSPMVPYEMRNLSEEAQVTVLFEITEKGMVRQVEVEEASHRMLAESVITAVRQWRFAPATIDGEVTAVKVRLPVIFAQSES
jgi:TonB family protein